MSSPHNHNSTGLDSLDTQDIHLSLLANKVKVKDDNNEDFETSIDVTPAYEVGDSDLGFDSPNLSDPDLINDDDDDAISVNLDPQQPESPEIKPTGIPNMFSAFNSGGDSSPSDDESEKKEYSPREERKRKFEFIYKIKALAKKGIPEPFAVDMSSKLEDIELTYNEMYATYQRKNSVTLQRKMLVMSATLVEFLNNRYDPFDFKLDGWSESIYDSVNNEEYDEVLEELYEKYKSKAKMAPEVKLLMMMGGSAFMHHTLSSAFKPMTAPVRREQQPKADMTGPSGLDEILRDFKGMK
jgi:hypothetical protein